MTYSSCFPSPGFDDAAYRPRITLADVGCWCAEEPYACWACHVAWIRCQQRQRAQEGGG